MTVKELIDFLNEKQIPESAEVRVHAFGGMRGGKRIKSASVGFDWDMNSIVLHPDPVLTIYAAPVKNMPGPAPAK